MGGLCRYHITMMVTTEEENAIRSLYRRKKWTCLINVLTDETVANIYRSGLDEIFPNLTAAGDDFFSKSTDFREIKTEVEFEESDENEADTSDNDDDDEDDDELSTELGKVEEYYNEDRTDSGSETDTAEEPGTASESDIDTETKNLHQRLANMQHGRQLDKGNPLVRKYGQEKLKKMGYLKCEACGNYYFGRRSLRHHYYHVHRDLMPKPICPVCNQEFENYKDLLKHKREKQHGTKVWMLKTYQCDTCGKLLSRYSTFMNHKKYVCGRGGEDDEDMRTHPCDYCGKLFKSERDAKSHRQVHFKVESICDVCGKVCLDKRAMQVHRRRHDEANKTHMCNYCGKAFFRTCNLQQHIRTHTKEKPYKCPLCPYTSAIVGNITKHTINVHKEKMAAVDLRKAKETVGSY